MNHFLLSLLLFSSFTVLGQANHKNVVKKAPPHKVVHKPVSSTLPKTALNSLGRTLIYYCSDAGDDYIRAFVYGAYISQGLRQRYQVDEQLGMLATSKKSRDTLLSALYERCSRDESAIVDNLYSSLHMSLLDSKTLAHFVMKNYAVKEKEELPDQSVLDQ